jgi:large repetitive protein
MYHSAGHRFAVAFLAIFALALPLFADNVTVSGTTTFAALDGSSLDHDGVSNGTFTVDDGNLTVLGTINCNDTGQGNNSACPMHFVVSGNFLLESGAAIYAENRIGLGSGGDVRFDVGGSFTVRGTQALQPGGIISTSRTASGNPGSSRAGYITINAVGAFSEENGALITAASQSDIPTKIEITANGGATVAGSVLAGPHSTVNTSTMYSGTVFTGGSSHSAGGDITIRAASNGTPAVTIASTGIVASQAESDGPGHLVLEGCRVEVKGLVASLADNATGVTVIVRSASSVLVDGRDLSSAATARRGMIRADSTAASAASFRTNIYAVEGVQVLGPTTGTLYAVNSNGGPNGGDSAGTVNVLSLQSTVTASGNAFAAANNASGDQGGKINLSAKGNVVLNTAALNATGDFTTTSSSRKGGAINVRSYSGSVTWTSGVGDARPTGSSITAANRGTITITHCTGATTTGTSFPTNGAPVGAYPTIVSSCSPAAPSLPEGEFTPDCNDPPVAANDAYSVAEGGTLTVPAPGVLTNDVDPDGDPITAVLVSGPSNASSFTLNADGSFSYTHNGGETTSDSFTYQATDGVAFSNTATVTITITPVNDPPVAVNDNYSVAEGGTINLAVPGVLVNDTDPDGPTMTAVLVSGPAHASSFTLNPNGSFQYVHDGSETLTDSFTYQASDGSLLSNVATVSITITPVNDAPVAVNDNYGVNEGGTLNGSSVLANDTDAENNSLTAVLVSGPAHASSFVLNANGTFTYVHDGSETPTTDSFTYRANDGAANSNVATVTITITPVNDAPVAVNDAYNVNEGGTLNGSSVLANDTDAENNPLTAVLVSGPAHASSFVLNANGTFTYVHDGSETPASDSFTYKANDGLADSNVATVTITINPVNDAPVAVPDAYSVNEGGTLTVAAPGVLGNDTDAENSSLTAVLVSGPANATSFTLNADGSFSYVHNGSETTTDSFTYKANDGLADSNTTTVTITINPVNEAPTAVNDAYNVNEGGTLNGSSVLANDTDPENDTLNAVLVSGPAHASSFTLNANGTFTYVHDGSESPLTDSFTYKANDGSLDSNVATVTITIAAVNDAPVANPDAYSVDEGDTLNGASVLINDTDAENDPLTAVLVSGPSNASAFVLNPDGTFTYIHNGSETTSDSFTYKANDGLADSNVTTVTITINPVNDPPVANPDSYNVNFHGTLNVLAPGVLGNDTDVDGPGISAILVTTTSAGNLTFNADGSFTYQHTGPTPGTDSFTYKANDGLADSNVTTVTITINNQAPVANNDAFFGVGNTELRVGTGAAAHPAAVVSGTVLANDTDPDSGPSPLTVSAFDAVSGAGGTVSMNANGTFNFLPATGFTGVDSFNYTVSDGLSTDVGTVLITLTERVWYVNPAAAGPQSGRSTDPFATIGQAQGASAINDYIHVAAGSQATGILLKNGQRLIGSGVALVVGPFTLTGATVRPTLGGTVILNTNNLVTGLNIIGISAGITGVSVSNDTIAEVGVSSNGDALNLFNPGGTFTLTNVTLTPGTASRGLVVTGGTATISATNLDVTTTNAMGITANAGTLNIAAGVDGSTVSTTNGVAVNLTGMAVNAVLRSVSASGAANGINLGTTTGSFTVTGNGSAGSGGTIQNTTGRGANLLHTGSVSLSWMNFTNAATANGDSAAVCGDTFNGTNTNCSAAIHLQGATSAALSNVNVTGGAQIGINGNGVANLTMNNVSVTGAGNENLEHGVQFVNLTGTGSVTNSTFSNNFHRQFTVQNSSGTLSLSVTGSTFSSNGLSTGSFGALISGHGTANITTNVQTSTFANNFGHGYQTDGNDAAVLNVTLASNIFTNNGGAAVLSVVGGSSLNYSVTGNTATGNATTPFVIFKGSPSTGDLVGTISNNTIGTAGVPGSGCAASCDAITLDAFGTGNFTVAADNNTIRNFALRGIQLSISASVNGNAAIRNNNIAQPAAGATAAILAQSGTGATDTSSLCADIQGNILAGTYSGQQIRVRNRFPTTLFRVPGFPGPANSTAAMVTFLGTQNGGATATATLNGNTFGGGASCVAP